MLKILKKYVNKYLNNTLFLHILNIILLTNKNNPMLVQGKKIMLTTRVVSN